MIFGCQATYKQANFFKDTYFPVSIVRPWSLIFSATESPCGRPYYDLVANFLILHFPMWSLIITNDLVANFFLRFATKIT